MVHNFLHNGCFPIIKPTAVHRWCFLLSFHFTAHITDSVLIAAWMGSES